MVVFEGRSLPRKSETRLGGLRPPLRTGFCTSQPVPKAACRSGEAAVHAAVAALALLGAEPTASLEFVVVFETSRNSALIRPLEDLLH